MTCLAFTAPSAPPTNISILEVGSRHIDISWEPPLAEYQNGIIRLYRIRLGLSSFEDEESVFTTSHTNITLEDLLPYHHYTFTVVAVTFRSGPESEPKRFQSMEDGKYNWNAALDSYHHCNTCVAVPSVAPLLFEAVNISTRGFVLSWAAPAAIDINGVLRKYMLSVAEYKSNLLLLEEVEIDVDANINATVFVVNDLTPYTQYNCSVSAVTIGNGPIATIQVRTEEEGRLFL